MTAPGTVRPGGRTSQVRSAVLDATLSVLAELGYSDLSIERIAELSGVNKSTIYRRWQTKEAVLAAALDDVGRVHFLMGAPDASLACHRAALAVRERLGDDRGRALGLARMGQVEHETGNLEAAGRCFRDALALRRRVGDRPGEVASLIDLGGLELDLGRVDEAVARLEEGRTLARELGDLRFTGGIREQRAHHPRDRR